MKASGLFIKTIEKEGVEYIFEIHVNRIYIF